MIFKLLNELTATAGEVAEGIMELSVLLTGVDFPKAIALLFSDSELDGSKEADLFLLDVGVVTRVVS